MPTHKDAVKRNRQSAERRQRNRAYRTRMRNQIKLVRTAITDGNADEAQAELRKACSIIHRLASKGVIHRNTAARRIHRLNRAVHALVADA